MNVGDWVQMEVQIFDDELGIVSSEAGGIAHIAGLTEDPELFDLWFERTGCLSTCHVSEFKWLCHSAEGKDSKPMIIGIVGKSGSGKDTAAAMIPGAQRFSFADPLKEFCALVFGWDKETLWGKSELRNTPDPRFLMPDGKPLTPRHALQTLGTEWGRACCPDVWAKLGTRRALEWLRSRTGSAEVQFAGGCDVAPRPVAVFSDCRFVNEAKAIREAGGQVWRICRPGAAGLEGEAATHPSEMEQESADMEALVTRTIWNRGTLDELRARVVMASQTPATWP